MRFRTIPSPRMGMASPQSFARTKGVGYEAEANTLFARFTTPPDATRKALINTLIKSLKAAGVWAKLDALYILAAADAQAARRNWVADQYNLTEVNSPTFTADRGYAGNGSTSYLKTGFNPATAVSPQFTQNSAHASLSDRTSRSAAATVEFGAVTTSFTAEIATRYTGDSGLLRINSNSSPPSFTSAESSGRFAVSRTGATAMQAYRNASSLGTNSDASASPISSEFFICCVNAAGGTPIAYSTDQISQVGFGAGLSGAEISAMDAAIAAYLTAVGA